MFIYIENIKTPEIRFKVESYDKESKIGKLRGGYGAEFSRGLSKEELARYGYRIVKSETELPIVTEIPTSKKRKKSKKETVEE